MKAAIYDASNGRIKCICEAGSREDVIAQLGGIDNFIRIPDDSDVGDDTHYVADGVIVKKSPLPVWREYRIMGVVFPEMPPGVEVIMEEHNFVTDGEPLEIEFSEPGVYVIEFFPGPEYMNESVEVVIG